MIIALSNTNEPGRPLLQRPAKYFNEPSCHHPDGLHVCTVRLLVIDDGADHLGLSKYAVKSLIRGSVAAHRHDLANGRFGRVRKCGESGPTGSKGPSARFRGCRATVASPGATDRRQEPEAAIRPKHVSAMFSIKNL